MESPPTMIGVEGGKIGVRIGGVGIVGSRLDDLAVRVNSNA